MTNDEKKRKRRNEYELLLDDLKERDKDGSLQSASPSLLEKLQSNISGVLTRVFNWRYKNDIRKYQSDLRKEYLKTKDDMQRRNISLSAYRLSDLNDEFRKSYRISVLNSLSLIRTQNEENMLKLKRRFYDWLTLRSIQQDTDTSDENAKKLFKSLVSLPKRDKRVKFILRDQTNKMVSAMDNTVAKSYKAIALQWKIRQDDRVAGKPGGKYGHDKKGNKLHGNHWVRRDAYILYDWLDKETLDKLEIDKFGFDDPLTGKRIRFAKELYDGLPGMPIGCRCWSKNIYMIEDLPKEYRKLDIDDVKREKQRKDLAKLIKVKRS